MEMSDDLNHQQSRDSTEDEESLELPPATETALAKLFSSRRCKLSTPLTREKSEDTLTQTQVILCNRDVQTAIHRRGLGTSSIAAKRARELVDEAGQRRCRVPR